MHDGNVGQPTPQFETAEYTQAPGTVSCEFCKQTLAGTYYRINDHLACPSCADQIRNRGPKDSHAAFVRAVMFGIPAAVLGLILYAAFEIMTKFTIGYLALGVGYLVGKAMLLGSGGLGGRRYQIVAAILTYAAVSMAAVPVGLSQMREDRKAQVSSEQPTSTDGQSTETTQAPKEKMSVGSAVAYLAFLGLASPFMELQSPVSGLIGLVILYVGLQIAWKLTAGASVPQITGPY